jgi:cell division septation protein DedD
MGDPDVIAPLNLAAAVNENCTSCQTLASAYQFVIALGTPVRLTGRGQRAMRRIFRELRALKRAELPIDQVRARLHELMKELRTVLTTQVVKKRDKDDRDDDEDRHEDDEAGEEAPASEAASPEPTPAPAETQTPEPVVTPEPTPEPTQAPTETPTPEETPTATPAP